LKLLISPLIQTIIDHLRSEGQEQTDLVVRRLQSAIGNQAPHLWRVNLCPEEATAATEFLSSGGSLALRDLTRDPHGLSSSLSCVPLMIERGGEHIVLPTNTEAVQIGDELVFCGTERSGRLLMATLNNPYTLHYLVTGTDPPRGYILGWLAKGKP
jgi:hypothetical protein